MLLLTRAAAYDYLSRVTVADVTTTVRGIPQEVALGRREGLDRPAVANLDNVYAIAKARLGERIGHLAAGRQREIKRALGYALDWEELKVL